MTSASELFYTRRSRFGRNSSSLDLDLESNSSSSNLDRSYRRNRNSDHPHLHHHHNSSTRRDRLDLEGCDVLRRHLHQSGRHPLRRFSYPPQERESSRLDQGTPQIAPRNASQLVNGNNLQDRLMLSGNGRLPGAVLLARERLLQRLSGVTSYGSRRSNRSSSAAHQGDCPIGDDFHLIDVGDWETEISIDWLMSTNQQTCQRPPGLTQEMFNHLPVEKFSVPDEGQEVALATSRECSICLESFCEGDELICLPCEHRFHPCCLHPWIRSCGDCPYCRRGIVVTKLAKDLKNECNFETL